MNLKSLKTLQWVKQRRLEALEKQLQAQAEAVAALEAARGAAEGRLQACRADEARCVGQMEALAHSERFRPDEVVTLGHVLQGLADATRQAADAVAQAERKCQEGREALALMKKALQRAERQRDQLEERRVRRLREIDQEGEDTQDEESEEAAVARRVAARHAEARVAA